MAKKRKTKVQRKTNIERQTSKKEIRRSTKDDGPIILEYKETDDKPIRIDKNQRWPSKPSEHLEHRRKMFKTFLENDMDYGHKDMALILQLWDYSLNADNIMGYAHVSTPDLYKGIINDNLHIYYREPKTIDSINTETAEKRK